MTRTPSHPDVEFLRPPGLQGVELRYSCYRTSAFRTHTHPAWSVGLLESGSTTFTLSGRSHRAIAGEMVVIPAGRAHACNPDLDASMAYRMFYLAPDWLAPRRAGGSFPDFHGPVIRDPRLFATWSVVWERLTGSQSGGTGADPVGGRPDDGAADGGLSDAISALIEGHASVVARPLAAQTIGAIEAAKRVLERDLAERVTLSQLEAEVGMSRSHLSRVFAASVGLPPHTYRNQMRIERAREMLAEGKPPSDISSALGFSDQAHFSRVFREFTGATPSQYQSGMNE